MSSPNTPAAPTVAFQGEPGAYSEIAARQFGTPLPRRTFPDVFDAVISGEADFGALPMENNIGGPIPENVELLERFSVNIIAETVIEIRHCLLGLPGATIADATRTLSHWQALRQCGAFFSAHPHLTAVEEYDTAGSAKLIAEAGIREHLAIASELAAEHYGLEILAHDIADRADNATRFIFIARRNAGGTLNFGGRTSYDARHTASAGTESQ